MKRKSRGRGIEKVRKREENETVRVKKETVSVEKERAGS